MLMIVSCHFAAHGGFTFLDAASFTVNKEWWRFLAMGGDIGNTIFLLLSGYFLIGSSGINSSKIINLWLRMFFWSVTIYCVFVLAGFDPFSLKNMLKSAMPVTQYAWWFASTYFMLYIFHPYLNILLRSLSKSEYRKFLIIFMVYHVIVHVSPMGYLLGSKLANFMFLYSLAGYIRLHANPSPKVNYIFWGFVALGVNLLCFVVFDAAAEHIPSVRYLDKILLVARKSFALIIPLCLMVGFSRLTIPNSKLINLIASATFGVYLIHDNDNNLIRQFLWHTVFKNAAYQDSLYFIPYSIAVILMVYISCVILELIRAKVFKTISGGRLS